MDDIVDRMTEEEEYSSPVHQRRHEDERSQEERIREKEEDELAP